MVSTCSDQSGIRLLSVDTCSDQSGIRPLSVTATLVLVPMVSLIAWVLGLLPLATPTQQIEIQTVQNMMQKSKSAHRMQCKQINMQSNKKHPMINTQVLGSTR